MFSFLTLVPRTFLGHGAHGIVVAIACLSVMLADDILVGGDGTVSLHLRHSHDPQWAWCCVD